MAEFFYIFTVIYFIYVVHIVLGDEIEAYCNENLPLYGRISIKLIAWAKSTIPWTRYLKIHNEGWKALKAGPKL